MGVRFFFEQAQSEIVKHFGNVFGGERAGGGGSINNKVAAQNLYKKYIKPFGWLNSLYAVAEKKIFTIEGENEIDSVHKSNLYKVLNYLSWENAKGDYESAMTEKIHANNKVRK